jgi:hypothetical protein
MHAPLLSLAWRARWSSPRAMVERVKASFTFHAIASSTDGLDGRLALFELVSSSTLGVLSCDAQKIFRLAARESNPPPASAGVAS